MKRILPVFLILALLFTLAACSDGTEESANPSSAPASSLSDDGAGADSAQSAADGDSANNGSRILIAYFSMPEDVDTEGTDAVAGASIVVDEGQVMGNVEYMAHVIRETVGGDLFRIETVQQYPLVDQAAADFPGPKKPCLRQRRSFYLSWNFRFQIPFPFPE